jgi:hypothetical protein
MRDPGDDQGVRAAVDGGAVHRCCFSLWGGTVYYRHDVGVAQTGSGEGPHQVHMQLTELLGRALEGHMGRRLPARHHREIDL